MPARADDGGSGVSARGSRLAELAASSAARRALAIAVVERDRSWLDGRHSDTRIVRSTPTKPVASNVPAEKATWRDQLRFSSSRPSGASGCARESPGKSGSKAAVQRE